MSEAVGGMRSCHAERDADTRFGRVEWGGERVLVTPASRIAPLRWNKQAKAAGERHRALCAIWSDWFDNQVPTEWRTEGWTTIKLCRYLDWLILTKRPMNILKMLPARWGDGWPNCWMGASVENQTEADRRIPILLIVPAFRRWLSVEPMLGPVDLRRWLATGLIHFVVIGGESGANHRPMELDWCHDLLAQCRQYGVAFYMKQMSATHPKDSMIPPDLLVREFPV